MIAGIIYIIVGIIEVLLGFRIVFRLIGANPASAFVNWIYGWSSPLVAPFTGIFGQDSSVTGQGVVTTSVIDWAAIIALIIIGVIGVIISRFAVRSRVH